MESGVFYARARHGHHGGDGVAPGGIVGGLLVRDGGGGRAVDFDQDEAGWIVIINQKNLMRHADHPCTALKSRELLLTRLVLITKFTLYPNFLQEANFI